MMYLQAASGFILLLVAAEVLVRGAVILARILGISPLVIGMTVVAFGTSAPEFVVTAEAALKGVSGIAMGNVIGSNIANILLILGVAGLIKPIAANRAALSSEGVILMAGTVVFMALCFQDHLGLGSGVFLLVLFVSFLFYSYKKETGSKDPMAEIHTEDADEVSDLPGGTGVAALAAVLGLIGIAIGADLLVEGSSQVARTMGVSEEVIGLTMIAIGTSLPELATSVMAARRGHSDVAVGNVLGSNLFNMLGVMGVAATLSPVTVAPQIFSFDIWVMGGVTILAMLFLWTKSQFSRTEAGVFLALYIAYIAIQALGVESLLIG